MNQEFFEKVLTNQERQIIIENSKLGLEKG